MKKGSKSGKIEMNWNKNPVRPFGQRSIASTFLSRASNRSDNCEQNAGIKACSKKGSGISLSDFLNRKLHRSSVLPISVEGKEISSLSPSRDVKGESGGNVGREVKVKSSINGALDINILKNIEKGGDTKFKNAYSSDEIVIIDVDNLEQTRKRKCLFEELDHDDIPTGRKRLVVLGDDSKPRSSKRKNFASEEKRSFFNHYDNGGGQWSENMAGVDNEEVGCNDAWEGVGYTKLGGIEWH